MTNNHVMVRCSWCGHYRKRFSEWKQREVSTGKFTPLCRPCVTRRLKNPWNALLDMRKTKSPNDNLEIK